MYDFKHISAEELHSLLQQGDIRLIDVRTDAEVARGKIPQGESIPLHLIPLRLNELDKQAATVFYCQMGGRSAQAAPRFTKRCSIWRRRASCARS